MPKPTKKILFTQDVRVLAADKSIDFEAKAGEVRELTASSANRWLRRNMATEDVQGAMKATMSRKAEEIAEQKQPQEQEQVEDKAEKAPTPKKKAAARRPASDTTKVEE